ncbi:MAG: F0F1 ATP synthase subunit B [Clostridiales bacterium]|jgi:F-type H+-transporting ATPase subunit b|nr:F0F1 ATP synthase subunit B [Clostridiales bacterium]
MLELLQFSVLSANGNSWFLRFDLQTLIDMGILWLNAAFIIFILHRLLNKPIKNFLNNRRERIAGELARAAADMKEAEEKRGLYEGKLSHINEERDGILEDARKLANQKEAEIIQGANDEARLIMDRAKLEIEREKEKAKDEMKSQIIQVSALMAERLMGQGMDEAAKDRILNEAIVELGDAVWKG